MLKTPNPENVARSIQVLDEINSDPITRADTRGAIPSMSSAKASCEDDINVELFNADISRHTTPLF